VLLLCRKCVRYYRIGRFSRKMVVISEEMVQLICLFVSQAAVDASSGISLKSMLSRILPRRPAASSPSHWYTAHDDTSEVSSLVSVRFHTVMLQVCVLR